MLDKYSAPLGGTHTLQGLLEASRRTSSGGGPAGTQGRCERPAEPACSSTPSEASSSHDLLEETLRCCPEQGAGSFPGIMASRGLSPRGVQIPCETLQASAYRIATLPLTDSLSALPLHR